jgi:hypothetical protein
VFLLPEFHNFCAHITAGPTNHKQKLNNGQLITGNIHQLKAIPYVSVKYNELITSNAVTINCANGEKNFHGKAQTLRCSILKQVERI